MTLFKPATNSQAYLKAGFMGFAGSGKTTTATYLAIGLVQHMRERNMAVGGLPIMFLDTETGADWVQPEIEGAGIKLMTAKTRAFKDLMEAVNEAEKGASVLLIDSISHFWTELTETYQKQKKRNRLEFSDWAYLKGQWRRFTDRYVNSQLHIIMCGRAGYEYDHFTDEAGKKQIEKSGIKMRAEGETTFEPSLLVLMERNQDMTSHKVSRVAHVMKDRSRTIDGKDFANPTFKHFLPHVEFLNLGGEHVGVDIDRTSADLIPDDPGRDTNRVRRQIVLEEIEALLVKHYPSQTAADKKAKAGLIQDYFDTTSWTEISELMPLHTLQANYDALHRTLENEASHYGIKDAPKTEDSIPYLDAPLANGVHVEELAAKEGA